MGGPFGDGCVRTPSYAERVARQLNGLRVLPHCASVHAFAGRHCALAHAGCF